MKVFDLLDESSEINQKLDKITIEDIRRQEEDLKSQGFTEAEIQAVLWVTAMEKVLLAKTAGEDVEAWEKMAEATKTAITDVTSEIKANNG